MRFVYPSDEWFLVTGRAVPPRKYYDGLALEENGLGMVRAFLDDWKKVKREPSHWPTGPASSGQPRRRPIVLVTASLFEPVLRKAADEFNATPARA